MGFFSLSFLLFLFVLFPLHIKCDYLDNFPFKLNYVSLWGEENMRILDEGNEVQLTLNQHSGKIFIQIIYIYINYKIIAFAL